MFKILPVSIHFQQRIGTPVSALTINPGREIPEDVAAKTDQQNEFPAEMWKKLGDAG